MNTVRDQFLSVPVLPVASTLLYLWQRIDARNFGSPDCVLRFCHQRQGFSPDTSLKAGCSSAVTEQLEQWEKLPLDLLSRWNYRDAVKQRLVRSRAHSIPHYIDDCCPAGTLGAIRK